ncbi:MAG: AraC family transcriptional regulator [Helicobacteraceae bacterium]|nr:AraC family transcriptional regulator [Helicobacteraceae bacterium]
MRKGDIFIIPPFVAHSCYTKEGIADYTVLCINDFEKINEEIIITHLRTQNIKAQKIINLLHEYSNKKIIEDEIIKYIIEFIGDNYFNKVSIETLAKKLGYSPYYILHLFKEKVGLSIHQYIIQIRIKKPKEYKNENIVTIALENGFYDQSNFIKHFKKHEGITPKKYFRSIIK